MLYSESRYSNFYYGGANGGFHLTLEFHLECSSKVFIGGSANLMSRYYHVKIFLWLISNTQTWY